MRAVWATFLATVPLAVIAGPRLPRLDPAAATPTAVTLVTLATVLWICFTAERDSRGRLERAKRAFAVHGDPDRLLRSHLGVFVMVLVRLEVVVVCGLITTVWGSGQNVAVWYPLLAGLMMVLAWPTEHKVRLLLARGREVRNDG
jgi:hypothetical protein